MAVAHVKTGAGTSPGAGTGNMAGGIGGGLSKTFTYTPNAVGNVVLFWVVTVPSGTSPTTCSMSATGWSFTQIGGIVNGGTSGGCAAMFWAYAPNTSAATITMTWNQATTTWFSDLIDEFSGMGTSDPIAGNNSATGTGTPTVSVTPSVDNCMIWVPCNDSVTAVGTIGGSTATKGADDTQSDWTEYLLLSGGSGASQSCTFTGSTSYIIGAVAVSPFVGPSAGSVPSGAGLSIPAFSAKFLFFDTGDYGIGV